MHALSVIAAYLHQRARLRVFVPLSIVLSIAGCSFIAPWSVSLREAAVAALEALGLVLGFRIWDDIEDREFDRVRHPDRVSSSVSTIAPLQVLGFALASAALVPLTASPFPFRRFVAAGFAIAILTVWYGARSTSDRRPALAEHIVAVKYPLIAYAVAPALPTDVVTARIVAILLAVYALVCAYAYADDVELRNIFTSRRSTI